MTNIIKNTLKWRKELRELFKRWERWEVAENEELLNRFIQINKKAKDVIIDRIDDKFAVHLIVHFLNKKTNSNAFYVCKDKFIVAKFIPEMFLDDVDGIADYIFCTFFCFSVKEYIYENKKDPEIIDIVKKYKPECTIILTKQYSKDRKLFEKTLLNIVKRYDIEKARKTFNNIYKNLSPHFFKDKKDYEYVEKEFNVISRIFDNMEEKDFLKMKLKMKQLLDKRL